ncbi:MAG: ACT domain-containing protein [Bacteroidetes bacterium]|nr:ACT domain-containing protein [Bacteroidota bacterium]MCY4224525.1 ACT domain-containing protein [Bacteroidota bacterium]
MVLIEYPEPYAIIGLPPECDVPVWANQGRFHSVTRTDQELSIICSECYLPAEFSDHPSWYLIGCEGPISFDSVGIIAKLTTVLAESGLSTLTVATYHTDYLLTRDSDAACKSLQNAGYEVIRANS